MISILPLEVFLWTPFKESFIITFTLNKTIWYYFSLNGVEWRHCHTVSTYFLYFATSLGNVWFISGNLTDGRLKLKLLSLPWARSNQRNVRHCIHGSIQGNIQGSIQGWCLTCQNTTHSVTEAAALTCSWTPDLCFYYRGPRRPLVAMTVF